MSAEWCDVSPEPIRLAGVRWEEVCPREINGYSGTHIINEIIEGLLWLLWAGCIE